MSDEIPYSEFPSVEQLVIEVGRPNDNLALNDKKEERFQYQFSEESTKAGSAYAHLDGLKDHYKHKKCWSYFLMALMGAMVIFQSIILGLVGHGVWSFSEYDLLLPTLLIQNLAQVVGLAVFVVKSLFRDLQS